MFTVLALLPSAILVLAYGTIIVTVVRRKWKDHIDVQLTSATKETTDDKRQESHYGRGNARVIVMCAIVTVVFLFCWLPALILVYLRKYGNVTLSTHVDHYAHVMYYFHPVLNPLVYFFVDSRFRSVFLRLFRHKKIDHGNDDISMASVTEVGVDNDGT